MISLNFIIRNPWNDRFLNLFSKAFNTPFKNKYIEIEAYKDSNIMSVALAVTTRQDHSGLTFEVGLAGYCFHFKFYDSRHWNYKHNHWE